MLSSFEKKGNLLAGYANPLVYIFDLYELENENLVVKNKIPYSDIEQLSHEHLAERIRKNEILEFGHSLQSQILGFGIVGFYEDISGGGILDNYIDTYITTRAIKL